ncbi:MAG: NB-ARC domain protein [Gemmataceae bacterium]|nr:NB-ARC domain protein [Gemmataceae bacterium]
MRSTFLFGLIALLPSLAAAQEKDTKKVEPLAVVDLKRNDPVSYDKEIEPIFYKKCITCHSGSVKEGKLDMATYEGLAKGGRRGLSFIPGKGSESLVYKLVHKEMKPYMPPKGEEPVTPQELALMKLWIDQGAKAPTGVREAPKVVVSLPPANVVPVRAVAVSPDKKLVAGSRGNQIHVYEAKDGKFVRTLVDPDAKVDGKEVKAAHVSLVESMTWSPDGKLLVSGSFQQLTVWNPEDGKVVQRIGGFAYHVVALAFSLDGKLLATGGGVPTGDGEVKIFEVAGWKQIMDVKNGHSDTVYGVAFSPDAKMLATGSADKFVKVWEVPSAKFVKSFEGHTHHVLDVGWQADGKLLASAGGDNTVKVWDFEKGEQARTIQAHAKQVTRLLFIGKKPEILTAGGDNAVKMFNVTNGGNTKNFPGATDFVYGIGASPDGEVVATGSQDGQLRVYNGASGALIKALLPPDAMPKEPEKKDEKKK